MNHRKAVTPPERMCKGNDIQRKVEGSRSDRTDEPGETGSVEAQAEERGQGRMNEEKITCPECGKEVGCMVFDGFLNQKALGAIPCYHIKYDYRKSARIGFGKGCICRKCARQYFPEGIAYKVTVNYHGKRITPYIGIKQTGLFATRKEAYYAARDMNNRDRKNMAQYEEIKV